MNAEPGQHHDEDPHQPTGRDAVDSLAERREFVEGILGMYRQGWFPMADPHTGRIDWFKPRVRGVIPLGEDEFHVSQTLRSRVRSGVFEIRYDTAFRDVITACSAPRKDEGDTWIDQTIIETYCLLHEEGIAHSVEAWRREESTGTARLVGGLYGLHIAGAFFGESMFSRPREGGTDASKVCLVHLVERLRKRGFVLLDAQLWNEHLAQFGCSKISEKKFEPMLADALSANCEW